MNKIILTIILLLATSLFSLTVDQILDKAEASQKTKTSRTEMTETVYKSDGSTKISKIISYGMNGTEKGLSEYVSPKRIKGMKVLMLNDGDDIWFYSKRTNRVRKIASHQKKSSANGSDFSYEDMSMDDNREKYDYKLLGDENKYGKDCYTVEFKAKDIDDQTYSKLIFWIDKSNFVTIKGEFYDEDGSLWKILSMRGIKKIGNYWTAEEIEMKNVMKETRTVMKMTKIEFDIDIDENMFTERKLKR